MELVVGGDFADGLPLVGGDELQPVRDVLHHREIDVHVEAGPPGIAHELLRRGVRGAVVEGGGRGVHRVGAVLHALHHHVGREPGQAVAVDLQRQAAACPFRGRDQGGGALRGEQPARILEEYPIDAERDHLPDLAGVVRVGVHRAHGVDDGLDSAAGIEHVVDDEQAVVALDVLQEVVEPVHAHLGRLSVDAAVGRGADGDVVGLHPEVVEQLLHRDADGGSAPPDGNDEARPESALEHPRAELERVFQQRLRTDVEHPDSRSLARRVMQPTGDSTTG